MNQVEVNVIEFESLERVLKGLLWILILVMPNLRDDEHLVTRHHAFINTAFDCISNNPLSSVLRGSVYESVVSFPNGASDDSRVSYPISTETNSWQGLSSVIKLYCAFE